MTHEWFSAPANQNVSKIKCFIADMQEPYMILKRGANTPLFSELFYNYGYNKVELFEHLRAAGFQFYILNHAFAIDIPHPNSAFRNSYLEDATGLWTLMRRRYMVFLRKLNIQYSENSRFPICDSSVQDYYSVVWLVC